MKRVTVTAFNQHGDENTGEGALRLLANVLDSGGATVRRSSDHRTVFVSAGEGGGRVDFLLEVTGTEGSERQGG